MFKDNCPPLTVRLIVIQNPCGGQRSIHSMALAGLVDRCWVFPLRCYKKGSVPSDANDTDEAQEKVPDNSSVRQANCKTHLDNEGSGYILPIYKDQHSVTCSTMDHQNSHPGSCRKGRLAGPMLGSSGRMYTPAQSLRQSRNSLCQHRLADNLRTCSDTHVQW